MAELEYNYTTEFENAIVEGYHEFRKKHKGRLPSYDEVCEISMAYIEDFIVEVAMEDFEDYKECVDDDEEYSLDDHIEMYREMYWSCEEAFFIDNWVEEIVVNNALYCIDNETGEIIIGEQTILFGW